MKKKISVVIAGLTMTTILLGVSIAVLLVQESITNHAGVQLNGEISLYEDLECTVPISTYDWGDSFVANETAEKTVYVKSDANFDLWIGWEATGFGVYDAGTGFYLDTGTGITDCNFFFYMKQGGAQWRNGVGYLKPLGVGAVMPIVMKLTCGYYPMGGVQISFILTVSSYDT